MTYQPSIAGSPSGGVQLYNPSARDGIGKTLTGDRLHHFRNGRSICGLVAGEAAESGDLQDLCARFEMCPSCAKVGPDRDRRLMRQITDDLAECDPEVVQQLRVTVAASEPLFDCPPGVTEKWWVELRQLLGDAPMRRLLWSALTDMEARRT